MSKETNSNDRISLNVEIEYPDFAKLPQAVREKYESLPTKVNVLRMLGHSAGTYVQVLNLTSAIFKDLTLSDYHKELFVLLLAHHDGAAYEWEQHISIAQVAGVREDQFIAIAENRLEDADVFTAQERVFLRFGKAILRDGKASGVLFKHALEHFSVQELADSIIVLGYYRMLSGFIQTFNIPIDPQKDGSWTKG